MANKIKNEKTTADTIGDIAASVGILLMTAATTLGMLEMPDQSNSKIIMPSQPAFALASQATEQPAESSQLRREREETGPHYTSYSVAQRTPSRTGRL